MKLTSYALTISLLFSGTAFAQETKSTEAQTKLKIEETRDKNKVDGDIDQEITNARMRADSGSKSRYSLSTGLSYTGGAVKSAFGSGRPNLSGEPGVQTDTSAQIDVSGRYRWTKNDSLTFGTALGMLTPFQGKVGKRDQMNWSNPSLYYNRVGKLGPLQTTAKIGGSIGTSQYSESVDNDFNVAVSYSVLKAFENRWTAGVSVNGGYLNYDSKPGENLANRSKMYGGDKRSQFNLGVFPFAEYAFNDTYSFRTVFGYFNWKHLYGDNNKWRLLQTYVYQSVGVGISVTRDVYLYPNIQFLPGNLRSDFTNVSMSATLNVF
ncbi:MAG: hypothetical protein KF799_11365 [Bdellovibrionales bacterium]|nr:hypothetical protein [Bdellovibrionales bacterium]